MLGLIWTTTLEFDINDLVLMLFVFPPFLYVLSLSLYLSVCLSLCPSFSVYHLPSFQLAPKHSTGEETMLQ